MFILIPLLFRILYKKTNIVFDIAKFASLPFRVDAGVSIIFYLNI